MERPCPKVIRNHDDGDNQDRRTKQSREDDPHDRDRHQVTGIRAKVIAVQARASGHDMKMLLNLFLDGPFHLVPGRRTG